MDFSQIRYFLALSETLNFTRAAEKCNVTQPTLTQSIKRLEDELGHELITRDGRHTRLTPLGKELRAQFEKIEETRQLIGETAAHAVAGSARELNIGMMCTVGPVSLSKFLFHIREAAKHSLVCVHDIATESVEEMLLSGAIDVAICARHGPKNERLSYQRLFEERMTVAFSQGHAFESLDRVSLSQLSRENYLDRLGCEFRREFVRRAGALDFSFNVTFSSEREDWIQYMIAEGHGVSIMPEHSVLLPGICARPLREEVVTRVVELVMPKVATEHGQLLAMREAAATWDWSQAGRV